jgi:hypothetical protein
MGKDKKVQIDDRMAKLQITRNGGNDYKGNENVNPAAAVTPTVSFAATRAVTVTTAVSPAASPVAPRAANMATKPPNGPAADRVTAQRAAGLQRWKDFAQGGALVDDYRRAGFVLRDGHFERTTLPVQRKFEAEVPAPVQVNTLIELDEDDHWQQPIVQKNERRISAPVNPRVLVEIQQNLMDFDDSGLQAENLAEEPQLPAAAEENVSPAATGKQGSSLDDKEQLSSAVEERKASPAGKEGQVPSMSDKKQISAVEERKAPPAAKENVTPPLEGNLIDIS